VVGRRVSTPVSNTLQAGWHRLEWGGAGSVPPRSGVYFARLLVDGKLEGKRRVVILNERPGPKAIAGLARRNVPLGPATAPAAPSGRSSEWDPGLRACRPR
jgi:hypothetical protein